MGSQLETDPGQKSLLILQHPFSGVLSRNLQVMKFPPLFFRAKSQKVCRRSSPCPVVYPHWTKPDRLLGWPFLTTATQISTTELSTRLKRPLKKQKNWERTIQLPVGNLPMAPGFFDFVPGQILTGTLWGSRRPGKSDGKQWPSGFVLRKSCMNGICLMGSNYSMGNRT